MRKAWMFCRWLLTFASLTVLHAIASCVAFFFAYVAWESGPGWLSDVLLWLFFFPFVLLGLTGMVNGPLDDSLAHFAVNSVCWVAIVYPVRLVRHQIRRIFSPCFRHRETR